MRLTPHLATITTLALALGTAVPLTAAAANRSAGSGNGRTQHAPAVSSAARAVEHPTAQSRPLNAAPVLVRVTLPRAGFRWGDAGIGAASAVGALMIALAGALAITHRRARRTQQPRGGMR